MTRWTALRAHVARATQRTAERYGLRPRLDAAVWDGADTPATIQDFRVRRAGIKSGQRRDVDRTVLALALGRAPGWTPETLRAALHADFSRHSPGWAMQALAHNPALSMPWVAVACAEAQTAPPESPGWIATWVDRLIGPTPPVGWSSDPACWRPLLDLCVAAYQHAGDMGWVTRIVTSLVRSVTSAPDMTDAALAVLLYHLTDPHWAGTFQSLDETLPHVLGHPQAGAATRAAFCRWVRRIPGTPGSPWRLLIAVRPDWMQEPALRAVLSAMLPAQHHDIWPIFVAYADPAQVAKAWTLLFAADLPGALVALGTLPAAAIRHLPPLTEHDIQQCLAHAPTTEARLGLIAALSTLPVAADPPESPTVAIVPEPPHKTPVPVIPASMSAHDPVLRTWLSQQTPEYAAFEEKEAEAQREWRRHQNLKFNY